MFPPPRNRNKKQKKNRARFILVSIATVVAVFALFAVGKWVFGTRNTAIDAKLLSFLATDDYTATQESLLFVRDDVLSCIDYADNEKWSVSLLTSGMNVEASTELAAAYDDTRVQIFTANGEPSASKEFYGTIVQVRCGDTLTAVLSADYENQNRVILLDMSGNEVARYEFEGKYILDFGFFEGDAFYIYMLDGGSVVPVSRLMTYSADLANTGNLTVESQILQHLVFLEDDLYAIGTNQIIEMDYVGSRLAEKLIYGWEYRDMMVKGGESIFLMVPGGESSGQSAISTARILEMGKRDTFAQMPSATMAVSLGSSRLYAYTADKIRKISLEGETISEHALPFEATGFKALPTEKHALCFVGEAVYIIKLP